MAEGEEDTLEILWQAVHGCIWKKLCKAWFFGGRGLSMMSYVRASQGKVMRLYDEEDLRQSGSGL